MGDPAEISEQLRFLLSKGRIRDALELLNSQAPYRFTALFRFGSAGLDNLVLYDRTTPDAPRLASIPVGDSYCVYVRDLRDAFVVEDSLDDLRVADHPKRPVVRSYCGVPLRNASGELFGTVCHFDFDSVESSADAMTLLEDVAAFLDPGHVEDTAAGEVGMRIEALGSMLGLLLDTAATEQEAIDAFEEFARPLRQATDRMGDARRALLAGRVDALLADLTTRSRQRTPAH